MWYTRNKKFPLDLLVVCLVVGQAQVIPHCDLRIVIFRW